MPDTTISMLAAVVDALLPGDERWPSASAVGVQHSILAKLHDREGHDGVSSLTAVLSEYQAPFAGMPPEAVRAAVAAFETERPGIFNWMRNAAIYAYYEAPDVASAINGLGIPFRLNPHREGYRLPPFDPATQTPTHGRGHWISTEQVGRVDTSALDLESERTTTWGLQR